MFLTARDAIAAEFDIITTFDLHRSPVFVNKACGSNFVQDAEVRRKISEGGKRRYEDPAERERSRLLSTGKSIDLRVSRRCASLKLESLTQARHARRYQRQRMISPHALIAKVNCLQRSKWPSEPASLHDKFIVAFQLA